jgi:hypothetical protein
MKTRSLRTIWGARRGQRRRGVALIMVLLMVTAFGALATASVFLMSNSELFTRAAIKESDLKNAADAGLEMARSRIDRRGSAVPSDIDTLYWDSDVLDASGNPIPGVKVNVYAGQSGSSSGQFGSFLSLVAEAKDSRGNKFVRRSELTQESFAKFAYWTNFEKSSSGSTIVFGPGDQIRGPLWTNDVITINSGSPKAKFWDEVRTAKTIDRVSYGDFVKPPKQNQPPMTLPPNTALAKLAGYASQAGYSFPAPNAGVDTAVLMRIEFVAANLNPQVLGGAWDADSTDDQEGFFRVYTAKAGNNRWLRADYPPSSKIGDVLAYEHCGDWHYDVAVGTPGRRLKFYPASIHNTTWFRAAMQAGGMTSSQADNEAKLSISSIMSHASARCYPAGDPHLVATDRLAIDGYSATDIQKGGEDTTFTPKGKYGEWKAWPTAVQPTLPVLAAARPWDARYLHPIHRALNTGAKGVIHVAGTVAVTGVLRGRITLYAEGGNVVLIDDIRYANDPGSGSLATGACEDMLGIIASNDIVVADNTINTPYNLSSTWRFFDDTKDMYIHATLMALKESFRVQNYDKGPSSANGCEGKTSGRGCLYLTGGLIQVRRGAVGTVSGYGYIKRYSYDRCAADAPPPYFPVTGRYADNAYIEIEPAGFDVVQYFKKISPTK